MGEASPSSTVTAPTRAVFLSYASQDADAARRICDALRAAGVEVWFDQSELRGGDTWDRQIRQQIHDCRLFIAVISAHTEARDEGYFRREWRLAVERAGDMAEDKAFVVPVAIDGTSERNARVPDPFKHVQWTRLPSGETSHAFVERVKRLLSPEPPTTAQSPAGAGRGSSPILGATSRPSPWKRALTVAAAVLVVAALAYGLISKPWISKPVGNSPASNATPPPAASPAAFSPPPHSIAVLPFVNMSGEKEQEYFSEGLTEELLNSLSRINELQVAARTSSFSFQGEHPDITTVAHKLNVASVLEGSVRRSGHTIRITAQLNNAVTGFHIWSQTYDRDLGDVLQLQTEIATAVATALKVTLLGDAAAKIELGGTRNPAAFDAYLKGSIQSRRDVAKGVPTGIAAYTEAIRLDPNFALAFAGRSVALTSYAAEVATGGAIREGFEKAEADARHAIALAPELAQAHVALALALELGALDFAQANEEYQRALTLAPGDAEVLRHSGLFAAYMGHIDAGLAALRRVVVLDPLARSSHTTLGYALYAGRRFEEAAASFADASSIDPDYRGNYGWRGLALYGLGDFERARASCESHRDYWLSQWCLALVYDKLGRHADAEAELAKVKAAQGDGDAYQYVTIYAQWGERAKALEWLQTAMHLRDPGLGFLKTDQLLDPLRREPRFQAVMRELKFPD